MKKSKPWFLIITATLLLLVSITTAGSSQSQAPLAQQVGNPGDKSDDFQGTHSYKEAGCFKDTETRAIPLLEGSDPGLTGFYKERQDPIVKCSTVARNRGYQVFAIQNGGMCLSGPNAHNDYKIHGLARDCKDGKGGPWASDVYIFNDFPLDVYVFTGKLPKAGTDSNVYVTISGSMGSSRRIALEPDGDDRNPFEAGQKDIFKIHTIPLGTLNKVTIGHDNTGIETAGWYLEKVVVKDAANTMFKFHVNRWLAKDEDDGQIEREITITGTINPGLYKPLGCFKERSDLNEERAIPSLEGHDEMLDGQGEMSYKYREFPIEKCADTARRRGYVMFGIQDGGLCASSKEIQNTYNVYGNSEDCVRNGTGAVFSSSVYVFADQEPGFKDADGATLSETKDTNSQPVLPSDPAMQVWRQVPKPETDTKVTAGETSTKPSISSQARVTENSEGGANTPTSTFPSLTGNTDNTGSNVIAKPDTTRNSGGTGTTVVQPSLSGNNNVAGTNNNINGGTTNGVQSGGKNPESPATSFGPQTTSSETPTTDNEPPTTYSENTVTNAKAPATSSEGQRTSSETPSGNVGSNPQSQGTDFKTPSSKTPVQSSETPATSTVVAGKVNPDQPTEMSETGATTTPKGTKEENAITPEIEKHRQMKMGETPSEQSAGEENPSTTTQEKVPELSPPSTPVHAGTGPLETSSLLETQPPKVYKIAPEFRLPGEYTSPSKKQKTLFMERTKTQSTKVDSKGNNLKFSSLLKKSNIKSRQNNFSAAILNYY